MTVFQPQGKISLSLAFQSICSSREMQGPRPGKGAAPNTRGTPGFTAFSPYSTDFRDSAMFTRSSLKPITKFVAKAKIMVTAKAAAKLQKPMRTS